MPADVTAERRCTMRYMKVGASVCLSSDSSSQWERILWSKMITAFRLKTGPKSKCMKASRKCLKCCGGLTLVPVPNAHTPFESAEESRISVPFAANFLSNEAVDFIQPQRGGAGL